MRVFLAVLAWAWLANASTAATEDPEQLAQAAADAWVKMMDAGEYEAAWRAFFVQPNDPTPRMTLAHWFETAPKLRSGFGRFVSRGVRTWRYRPRCGVIEYDSVFERRSAVETLQVALFPDGWRVTFYSSGLSPVKRALCAP
jgi:hypothetical protein